MTTQLYSIEKREHKLNDTSRSNTQVAQVIPAQGLEQVSHEDMGRLQCVDWLKAHETHFSRAKIAETADLTGIPTKSVMGPINYRPLKSLGSPGIPNTGNPLTIDLSSH